MKFFLPTIICILHIYVSHAQIINSTNFESQATGTAYTRPIWQLDGFTTDTWDNGLSDRTMVDNSTSVSGIKSLRITYPAGQFGPEPNGAQIPLMFTPRNEAYMSYWLKFSDNFSWGTTSEGGKLPGLAGGDRCSGGSSCDGTNGFSARLMWRTGGKAVLYLYHMDKPATYGEDIDLVYPNGTDVTFIKGNWYHIMERVKINTDGSTYDGEVEIWVNGQQVLLKTGLRFTSNGDKVDNLYISTFHGGSDATWVPTVTCYTWLDDIKIGASRADVEYKNCIGPNIGSNKTLCGSSSVTLDANKSEINATFNWYKNNINVGNTRLISVSNPGTYVVVYDSLGCTKKDTVEVLSVLQANLGSDKKLCANSFEQLHAGISGNDIHYVWKKDGIVIPNSDTIALQIKNQGKYSVQVSATGCTTVSDTIQITSGLLTILDVSGNAGENVSLTIQETGTNYAWFSNKTGGTQLATGNTYATVIPTVNTYVYAQDLDGYTGLVGKPKVITAGSYTDNRYDRKMKFQVFKNLSIDSITIYPVITQNVTIRIVASDQTTVVHSVTYPNLAAGERRIAIGANLTPGIYYMDAVGTADKLRHSYEADTDIHFPYTINGIISILGSNVSWIDAKPYYLFFYNWRVSSGNTCARTPVLLSNTSIVTPTTQIINLQSGWNLFSINVRPADSTIATLFSGKDVLEIKDANSFWAKANVPALQSLMKITPGNGYLVKMNTAATISISGIPIAENVSNYATGWNLIGCPYQTTKAFSTVFNSSNCQIIKNFDGFWQPGGSINSISNFEPGDGYFIRK